MNESIRRNPARASRLATVVALLLAASAHGADFKFDIPAGDLKTALDAYVKQTGQQIVFKSDDVKGKTTPGVHGSLSDQQALDALLKGTGLQLRRDESGAVVVFPSEAVAGGASTQTAGGESQELEEVVVTATAVSQIYSTSRTVTRIDADPMLLPMSVSAVQDDLLRYQQATTLAEMTANVSGVTTSQSGSSFSRGFRMTNGQNGMTLGGVAGASAGALPVVAIDRVEVAKGPEQILQGNAAGIGGTVNAITKVPTPDDHAYIGAAAGSEGYYRFDADVNGTLLDGRYGRLMGEVIGSTSDQDGPKGTVGTSNDYVSAGLRWTNDDSGSDLTAVYQHNHGVIGVPPTPLGGEHLHNGAKQYVLGDPDSRTDTTYNQFDIGLEQRIVGTWYLDLTYQTRDSTTDDSSYFAMGNGDDPQVIDAVQSKVKRNVTTDIYRAGVHGQIDFGPVTNKLLLAYDYQSQDESTPGGILDVGLYSTDVPAGTQVYTPYDPPVEEVGTYAITEDQSGVLLTDQLSWDKWHALVGVRWLSIQNKYTEGKPVYYTSKSDDDQTLPQFGLVYAFTPRVSLYASYVEGFRGLGGAFRDAAGNLLPNTTFTQFEGGTKLLLLGDQLALTVAVYQLKQKNVPQFVSFDPDTFEFIWESVQGITSKGVEIELAGQPIRGLQLRTTFAYSDAKDDTTNEPPPNGYTPNTFSLWSQYWFTRNPGSGWWVGGGLSAWDAPDRSSGDGSWPGTSVVDLSAGYQAEHWQAIAGVKNVGDVQGYNAFGDGPIFGSDYYTAQRLAGREYRLDLSYRF